MRDEERYLRIVVIHTPFPGEAQGEHAVYHVEMVKFNEPFVVHSDTGGVVTIRPIGTEAEE